MKLAKLVPAITPQTESYLPSRAPVAKQAPQVVTQAPVAARVVDITSQTQESDLR